MTFIEDMQTLPFHIIQRVVFKNRRMTILFKSGNAITATCPEGNDEWEIVQQEMLKNLMIHQVEIYDN